MAGEWPRLSSRPAAASPTTRHASTMPPRCSCPAWATWRALHGLVPRWDCCVVRGQLIRGEQAKRIRRLVYRDAKTGDEPTLIDVPRRWLALDSDRVPRPANVPAANLLACAAQVIERLPAAFARATTIVQATAGHGIKPELRLRLWFWCSRAITGDELGRWLAAAPLDPCVFRPAQPIYTAAPLFAHGLSDHLPQRLAKRVDQGPLHVPSAEELRPPPAPPPATRTALADDTALRRLIARTLDRIASASEGQRHVQLRAASRTLGGLLDTAGIPRSVVERDLLNAVLQAGGSDVDQRNATATIAWGLDKGTAAPLVIGGRNAR